MSLGIVYPPAGRTDMLTSGAALRFELGSHSAILGGGGSGVRVPAKCFACTATFGNGLVLDRRFCSWWRFELAHEVPKVGERMLNASPLGVAAVPGRCGIECSAELVDSPVRSIDVLSVEDSGNGERMEVTFKPTNSVPEFRRENLVIQRHRLPELLCLFLLPRSGSTRACACWVVITRG